MQTLRSNELQLYHRPVPVMLAETVVPSSEFEDDWYTDNDDEPVSDGPEEEEGA